MPYEILDANDLQVALSGETWPKLLHDVALPLVCVSLRDCTTASLGPVDSETVATLRNRRYDYAPVEVPSTPIGWSIVSRAVLESISNSQGRLESTVLPDNDVVTLRSENCFITVLGLFEALRKSPAVLCHDDLATTDGKGAVLYSGRIFGLVTAADLNHREIRRACYELLVEVESRVAELVAIDSPDPWKWIEKLASEDDRARIVGYWNLSLRNNIDIQPHMLLTLSQLLNIAARSKWLCERLGYASRSKIEDALDHRVREFRNRVMHPVRPLVSHVDDVARWSVVLQELQKLLARLNQIP